MQIDPNSHLPNTPRSAVNRVTSPVAKRESGDTTFEKVAQLDQQVRQAPEVRPETVERGRVLIGDVKYPPDEAIQGIARLLAISMGG